MGRNTPGQVFPGSIRKQTEQGSEWSKPGSGPPPEPLHQLQAVPTQLEFLPSASDDDLYMELKLTLSFPNCFAHGFFITTVILTNTS